MTKEIPIIAWIIISGVAIGILILNIGLISAFWKKNTAHPMDNLKEIGKTIRQPWHKEDEQLRELARKAEEIRQQKRRNTGDDHF